MKRHLCGQTAVALLTVLLSSEAPPPAHAHERGSPAVADTLRSGATRPDFRYWAFVANESSDLVSVVRFGPDGAALERDFEVGIMPADLDGAHGIRVSPGGRYVYVSLAHGTPFGRLWKPRISLVSQS